MKKLILLFIPIMLAGQTAPNKKTAKPAPKPAGMTVPAGAVQIAPSTWRYVDKDGKSWIYRGTLVGIVKLPEDVENRFAGVKVIDKGDSFRFEKPALMGASIWQKKKSDLNDEEKAMVEYANSKAGQSNIAEKAPVNK